MHEPITVPMVPTAYRQPLVTAIQSGVAPSTRDAFGLVGPVVADFGKAQLDALGLDGMTHSLAQLCSHAADVYVGAVRCLTGGGAVDQAVMVFLNEDGTPVGDDLHPLQRAQRAAGQLLLARLRGDTALWRATLQEAGTHGLEQILLTVTWVLVDVGAAAAEHAAAHDPEMPEDARQAVAVRQSSSAVPDACADALTDQVPPGATFVRAPPGARLDELRAPPGGPADALLLDLRYRCLGGLHRRDPTRRALRRGDHLPELPEPVRHRPRRLLRAVPTPRLTTSGNADFPGTRTLTSRYVPDQHRSHPPSHDRRTHSDHRVDAHYLC